MFFVHKTPQNPGPRTVCRPEASAEDMMVACHAPASQVAGRYLSNGRVWLASGFARDERRCRDLWEHACSLAGIETHESLA
jgi:hypothetical protein